MAAALDTELHALAINVDIPPVSNALSRLLLNVPEMIRQAESLSRQRGEELLRKVEEEARKTGVEAMTNAITPKVAFLGEAAAIHARYYDFVFCGWEGNNPTSWATAEAVIFGSGRPTILLPELAAAGSPEHVAIAWDGSRVAARAVADAELLLRRAARITVLTVVDEKPLHHSDAAARLAQGLRKRGLPAEALPIKAEDCPIAVTLQERTIELGADILVMGAFGHSRMRDFVLGGATQGTLSDLRLPVLLSH